MIETVNVSDVEDQYATRGAAVVACSEGSELFLASSVPNLQLVVFIIFLEKSAFAIHAHRHRIHLILLILSSSKQQTSLPTAWISNYNNLKHLVILVIILGHSANPLPGLLWLIQTNQLIAIFLNFYFHLIIN